MPLQAKEFRAVKSEIRVLGVDDGKFVPHSEGKASVVGVVFRGGYSIEGVMHTNITIDGFDATAQITSMINNSPHCKQLRLVMLNGLTFAGFNVVGIQKLNIATRLPIIALTLDKPDIEAVHKALSNLCRTEERWRLIQEAGEIYEVKCRGKTLYVEVAGISLVDARKIVLLTSTRSCYPEPLRVAHMIASGTS